MEFESFGLKSYMDYIDKNNINVSSIHIYLRNTQTYYWRTTMNFFVCIRLKLGNF